MGNFQELKVWQKSKDLAIYLYKITQHDKFAKDFSLRDQIRRAAVSIPSNIAEGDELGSNKQAVHFYYIAKGSTVEVLTQSIIAQYRLYNKRTLRIYKRRVPGNIEHVNQTHQGTGKIRCHISRFFDICPLNLEPCTLFFTLNL